MEKFKLSGNFIDKYKRKKPPFGFNGLGELVYMRTYSRIKENGKNERWWETVQRVVEGTYSMQKNWIDSHQLGWNPWQAQASAQEMYDRMFNMKFLPPGRGLWAMGTSITEERGLYAALNNCAFVSTSTLKDDYSKPFCFLMDASMLGVGVGFDTKGAGEIIVKGVNRDINEEIYSPFNTYRILGLPPTPIANPGYAALYAVLHPATEKNLYFVADGTGGHAFATTFAQHKRNIEQWRQKSAK